jgi:AraC family transcriptional regulator
MTPRIENLECKKLVGKSLTMSLANSKIAELWQSFLPHKKEIPNLVSTDLISLVVYHSTHFTNFNPTNEFTRWATVEVKDFYKVPSEMHSFILPSGLYAVFEYKGLSTDHALFQYIFETWLPSSDYLLDDRPHFEVLGKKYRTNDPNSEEEIWIPIHYKN